MNELLSSGLWPRLRKLAKAARRKYGAIAYVTDDRFVAFGEGDVLVTDASDVAIKAGQTSAAVLKAAHKRGATIVSVAGLHSKLYVFDRHAIIGSANLSKGSEKRVEVALLTDQPSTVSSSRLLVERLKGKGKPVDKSFIARVSKLPVTKHPMVTVGVGHAAIDDISPRTWLVGLKLLRDKEDEREVWEKGMAEAEKRLSDDGSVVSAMRFRGRSRFRREAKSGDSVVRIWSNNAKKLPTAVYHHAPILHCNDDPAHGVTWFYVQDYPDAEETRLTWKQFQSLYSQVGLPGKLSQWAVRELAGHHSAALHDLWFDK